MFFSNGLLNLVTFDKINSKYCYKFVKLYFQQRHVHSKYSCYLMTFSPFAFTCVGCCLCTIE